MCSSGDIYFSYHLLFLSYTGCSGLRNYQPIIAPLPKRLTLPLFELLKKAIDRTLQLAMSCVEMHAITRYL